MVLIRIISNKIMWHRQNEKCMRFCKEQQVQTFYLMLLFLRNLLGKLSNIKYFIQNEKIFKQALQINTEPSTIILL